MSFWVGSPQISFKEENDSWISKIFTHYREQEKTISKIIRIYKKEKKKKQRINIFFPWFAISILTHTGKKTSILKMTPMSGNGYSSKSTLLILGAMSRLSCTLVRQVMQIERYTLITLTLRTLHPLCQWNPWMWA